MTRRSPIPQETYDRAYLLSDSVEGFDEFRRGDLSHVKRAQLAMLALTPGLTLLEVGMGRGELLCECARAGARVSGVDYSEAAVEIARETLREFPDADLRVADVRALPFADASFDRVMSGDVIEHVDREHGVAMLQEMYRVLRPGGLMLLHTSPNTVFMQLVYPLLRPLLRLFSRSAVEALEQHLAVNRHVHVHEYNLWTLRKVARLAGLAKAEVWIDPDILRSGGHRHTRVFGRNPVIRQAARLGRLRPVRFCFGNDLYLRCVKRA